MHIGLHNVGPVKAATIQLDKLTVLVGPNGSGKTTVSAVLYSALLAHQQARRTAGIGALRRAARLGEESEFHGVVQRLIDNWQDEFRDSFEQHLRRCLGRDFELIAREGRSGKGAAPRILVGDGIGRNKWQLVFQIRRDGVVFDRKHKGFNPPRPPRGLKPRQLRAYEAQMRRLLVGTVPRRAVYFPAARSGFMQMRSALEQLLYGALGAGYFDHITVGTIPGMAADFLQFVGRLDPGSHSKVPHDVVTTLEDEVLRGRIIFRKDEGGTPSVRFKPAGLTHSWPIETAATSAAELAPLLLYLRHHADPGDALLIDEPEAHFHPTSQIALAENLLKVSQSLRGTVIATHSEFVASGISNALLALYADEIERPRGTLIRVYEFKLPEDLRKGVAVQELEVDPREGFDIRQFSMVSEATFNRAIELYNRLHDIPVDD